jgi:hypothetical protein
MSSVIPRYLLERHFGNDQRMIRAMEEQSIAVSSGVAATSALQDATVIVLSPNGDFTNERTLEVGAGIEMEITDDAVILRVADVVRSENFVVTMLPSDNTVLNLPATSGTLIGTINALAVLGNYASDAAAAAGGVPVGGLYRNGSAVQIRTV